MKDRTRWRECPSRICGLWCEWWPMRPRPGLAAAAPAPPAAPGPAAHARPDVAVVPMQPRGPPWRKTRRVGAALELDGEFVAAPRMDLALGTVHPVERAA